jgi:pimeloyl-ACP methyl ester carboxylesterase
MKKTPEINLAFGESCRPPTQPAPPTDLLDPSAPQWWEFQAWLTGAPGPTTYPHVEGRLVNWLRAAAQLMNPLEILKQSAVSFYLVGIATRTPPDTLEGATALADLAVTGRGAYGQFRSQPPQDSDLLDDVRNRLTAFLNSPPDEDRLLTSVRKALDRAYLVAWALRDPNPTTRAQARASLEWIAVSGEDDPPDRPVNNASARYPQFDVPVTCQGHTIETRYMIALPPGVGTWPTPPLQPTRQVPDTPAPAIPADHEVILFLHGHSSRVEESADLVDPLHQAGLQYGKKYAVGAFDLPSNGYSQMIEHTMVAPSNATQFDTNPLTSSPATYPLLDFLVEFVISFVNALDQQVPIKDRVAAVIGGSLGGNLCLRLAERNDQPWIKNIVAWSPASVWKSFNHDQARGLALQPLQGRMNEDESGDPPRRIKFFYEAFDSPTGPGTPTQPKQWYSDRWGCKDSYIQDDRLERQEIYNQLFRRWHWRVALEQLLFSHLNTDTPDGRPRYASNLTHTLLAAGKDDDFNWANIYSRTQDLASYMVNTPGTSLFLVNTGHSIHNERPHLLANVIVNFLFGFHSLRLFLTGKGVQSLRAFQPSGSISVRALLTDP